MGYIFGAIALLGALLYWMIHGEPQYTDTPIESVAIDGTRKPMGSPGVQIAFDPEVSSDGNGSLRIDTKGPALVNLFDVGGQEFDLSFRQLLYEARVRTEEVEGPVYLVMQAGVTAGFGAMPVIGKENAVSGTNDWTVLTAAAGNGGGVRLLEARLQLQVDGPGTVWIDDIRLVSRQAH